jgi:hypothetical protein
MQELVLALSQRAACCYAKAGRVRSSALLCADVAVLALQRGQLDTAARWECILHLLLLLLLLLLWIWFTWWQSDPCVVLVRGAPYMSPE